MKVDLSCPVELRSCTLSFSDGKAQASLLLYNLSARRIASFEAVAKWRSSVSGRSMALPFCTDYLRVGGEESFELTVMSDRLPDADRLELIFTAVRYEDGSPDWRAGEGTVVEIAPMEPIGDAELNMLRAVAGADAVCFPRQDSQAWRCVCGRANANSNDSCSRCRRSHFAVLGHTKENIRLQYEAAFPAQTGASESRQTIAEMEAACLRQHSRRFRRSVAMVLAALALTAFWAIRSHPINVAHPPAEAMRIDN